MRTCDAAGTEHAQDQRAISVITNTRITRLGAVLRKYNLDELPQLFNVLIGDMSLVGPRPDVSYYLPLIKENGAEIFSVRPGMTGPATLKYRNEEAILSQVDDAIVYNEQVILPDKIKINKQYVRNYNFRNDLVILLRSIRPNRTVDLQSI